MELLGGKMSSRGTLIKKGRTTTDEYVTKFITKEGIKVLEGVGRENHSLPKFAHTTTSIYGKLSTDGNYLKEIRFFDKNGKVIIELTNHPEPKLNNGGRRKNVLHYHIYD